jgi:hypothetical protein
MLKIEERNYLLYFLKMHLPRGYSRFVFRWALLPRGVMPMSQLPH